MRFSPIQANSRLIDLPCACLSAAGERSCTAQVMVPFLLSGRGGVCVCVCVRARARVCV